jgi:hypothetical protein
MKLYPKQIRHVGGSRYETSVVTSDPDGTFEFEFRVTGDNIRVVELPSEFIVFLRHNTGPAKNLLAAILALDMSQGFEVPTP